MKKYIFVFLILFLFTQKSVLHSQVNVDYNYPFKIGNEFSYIYVSAFYGFPPHYDSSFVKYKVVKDTVLNGKKYFVFDSYVFGFGTKLLRMDTLSGRLLRPSNVVCGNYYNESLVDSVRAGLNDSVFYCYGFVDKCLDTSQVTLFGILRSGRRFSAGFGGGAHWSSTEKRYAQQFGIYYYYSYGSGSMGSGFTRYSMKGCVINGVSYGDTVSYIGIKLISSEIPNIFSLSQNYPNPFNPVTRIKYDVPKSSLVKIIIFDVLGREIEILVNESQKPGSYEVTWDGSRYASGVYFYKLVTDEYVETKKMVLIK